MWSSLPSNLRTVLGTALLLGLGVAAAAFTLSFFALRDAAQDPALAWGQGNAWLFPIGVDMALVFFEVLLLGASMVRIHDHGQDRPPPAALRPGHLQGAGAGVDQRRPSRGLPPGGRLAGRGGPRWWPPAAPAGTRLRTRTEPGSGAGAHSGGGG